MSEKNPPVSTRKGDDGTTTLMGSGRIGKDDPRVEVLGDVDEATSFLGLARSEAAQSQPEMAEMLVSMQRLLYRIMGDIAMPHEDDFVTEDDLKLVDEALETWRGKTELPNEFVIPGETKLGATLDAARSVTRRAERKLVGVGYAGDHPYAVRCVNRLSDVLYIAARNADGANTFSRGE